MEENEFTELSDEELDSVTAGINWQKFGKCILDNGGGAIPALSELVENIVSGNWPEVAIISVTAGIKTVPIVAKCWKSS